MPISDKAGSGKRLKREESGWRVHGRGNSVRRGDRCVRDGKVPRIRVSSSVLRPVRKGKVEVGESKKEQDKLVKIACP